MHLVAYAWPRCRPDGLHEEFYGHIVVGSEGGRESLYFGYWCVFDALPESCQNGGKALEEYLFENHTPGVIVNETNRVEAWKARFGMTYWKVVPWQGDIFQHIPIDPGQNVMPYARYSFNPDKFHSEAEPCYNCVKWVFVVSNRMTPGFLNPVEKWRIKNVIKQLEALPLTGLTNE